jgi:hypothetical protein
MTKHGLDNRRGDVYDWLYTDSGLDRLAVYISSVCHQRIILHSEYKMSNPIRTDYTSDLVTPPITFVHDLRYMCKSAADIQRACNVSVRTAKRLRDMQPVRRYVLEAALRTFYGESEGSTLRQQMKINMSKSGSGRKSFLDMLKAMVRYVQEFRVPLRVSKCDRRYWVFPPRDTMRRMMNMHIECEAVLRKICKECPEYCDMIFEGAQELRERLSKRYKNMTHTEKSRKPSGNTTT